MELNNQPLDLTNAVVAQTDTIALDESLIRKSRNATNYRIENQNGDPVSLYTRKTLTFAFMQVKKEDNQFYDFYVDLDELAKAINVLPRNLKAYLDLKGENGKDVLNELYNSSMVFQELNENEDEFNPQVFKIHLMSCSMRIGNRVYFRFDDSMKKILLEIGNANNPYYSFIANQSLSLNSTSAMDLFELIENELTLLEYKTTTNTKWKEIRLSIKLLRKITFTENKYKNTNIFVYTFLVRCLKNISEVTNTEIDLKSIKTDMPGTKATIVIMKVRHKKVPYIHNNNKYLLDEETGVRFYDDAELNECFADFYRTLNLSYSEDDINNWKNHLKKCVDESLGEETETLNIDIALKILRKSIRKNYKDLYSISPQEMKFIQNNKKNTSEDTIDISNISELFINSTKKRINYERLQNTLSEDEMKYADKMCNLLAYIAENSKDKRYKISGKYLEGGEILTHILKYTYDEVYAVTKNMVQGNIDINKPVSYYLSALDNQLKINDPEAYASVLDPSLGRNSKLEDIELDDDEDE